MYQMFFVTVWGLYISNPASASEDILKDLVEMSKGCNIQCGSFSSFYSTHCRDKLPDVGSEYSKGGGGTVKDSLDFVLQNFSETNRLWVRMKVKVVAQVRSGARTPRHEFSLALILCAKSIRGC